MRRLLFVVLALVLGSAAPLHAAEGGLLEVNTGLMVWTVLIFLIVLVILSRAAFPKILGAVEARERHLEGGLLEVNTGLMVWTVLIFLIVLVILSRAAFPKILGAVEARERHLEELAAAAERDRAEAAALLEENRRILEETRARVQAALAESRAEAEGLREQIVADARREQAELLERARRDIATEREVALDAVRRDAVELAIRAAEKLVRRNLDAEDNRRLVREYLGNLGGPAVPAGV